MPWVHHLTARFYEIDRAGIVFFGRFYEYCHAALEELLCDMFGRADDIFETQGFGMPLVHSEADYAHPTRMGDRLRVEVDIERRGTKSLTFRYRIVGEEDGLERCTCRLVHCFVDLATFESIPIPKTFLDALDQRGL